jgi:hydroxymethylpyrimidine pyrophosphatase-like HAD family hydrolase
MKGLISLDIDGTITVESQPISAEVAQFFQTLYQEGWRFVFITGCTFQWGHRVLECLTFPHYFAVQNGAIILKMPEKQIVDKKYLHKEVIPVMEKIFHGEDTDFVIYAGCEHQDRSVITAQLTSHLKSSITSTFANPSS